MHASSVPRVVTATAVDSPRPPAGVGEQRSRRGRRAKIAVGIGIGMALAVVVVAAVAVVERPSTTAIALPVIGQARNLFNADIGDPYVLPVAATSRSPGGYWVFGTNDWPAHVPTAFSPDLIHWQPGPDAMPTLPPWAGPNPTGSLTWAPAVLATGRGYLRSVSVPDPMSGRECIAAEASRAPEGPYNEAGTGPLGCQRYLGGSIDPTIVRDGGHRLHLLWKNDGNCCGLVVSLWEQDLSPDGLRVVGPPHRLLSADQGWEGGVIERPVVIPAKHGGWWLFHAGNNWDRAAYATGVAFCPTLTGPCRDAKQVPFLSTLGSQYSPGGLDAFTDLHGVRWVVYAIWNRPSRNGRFYCCRSVELARLVSS